MSDNIETMSLKEHIFKGYLTKNNNIVLKNDTKNENKDETKDETKHENNDSILLSGSDGNTKISVFVLKIQEYGTGGSIYLILNDGDEIKTKTELYNSFLEGNNLIGNFNYFHNPDLIFDIKPFDNDDYSEIKLHYTKPRHYKNKNGEKVNCAWRSITWDLFDEFLVKDE
jgi:hypothetical protein